jgi:hypothetical protein
MAARAKYEDSYGEIPNSEDESFTTLKEMLVLDMQNDLFHDYVRRRESFLETKK